MVGCGNLRRTYINQLILIRLIWTIQNKRDIPQRSKTWITLSRKQINCCLVVLCKCSLFKLLMFIFVLLFMALGSKLLFILNPFQQNICKPKVSSIINLRVNVLEVINGLFWRFFFKITENGLTQNVHLTLALGWC